jgi:hypothetical protein
MGLVQVVDKVRQGPGLKHRAEPGFGPLLNYFQRCFAVQLFGDELLELAEAKESTGDGVFKDAQTRASRLLVADGQISPESWWRGRHGGR